MSEVRKRRTQKEEDLAGSVQPNTGSDDERSKEIEDGDSKETRLTLMEEVFLERLHFQRPQRLHPH